MMPNDADAVPADEPVRTSALLVTEVEERFDRWFVETFHNKPGFTTEWFAWIRERADAFKRSLKEG